MNLNEQIMFGIFGLFAIFLFLCLFIPSKKRNESSQKVENKQIDNDAVDILVALGYSKREAKERVLLVFVSGLDTQELVKKAINFNK